MTIFKHRDGTFSSERTVTGGKHGFRLRRTVFFDRFGGGMDFKVGNSTTRFNNRGQSIGTSIKLGSKTAYFNRRGMPTDRLTAF